MPKKPIAKSQKSDSDLSKFYAENKFSILSVLLVVIVISAVYLVSSDNGKKLLGVDVGGLFSSAREEKFRLMDNGIPDQYIVVLKDQSVAKSDTEASRLSKTYGGETKAVFSNVLKGYSAKMTEAQARALAQDPSVEYVEQDGYMNESQVRGTTTQSWGLDRIDQRTLPLNNLYMENPTLTGAGVTVYVVDGGIRTSHIDFSGHASFGNDFVGGTCADGSTTGTGHGTHVASTIGGTNYGVASGVNLVSVRVSDCTGVAVNSKVVQGLDWIRQFRVPNSIVNMSLSGDVSSVIDTAVTNLTSSGVPVVIAAGNTGGNSCDVSGGRVPSAITVGATTMTDSPTWFTTYGSCIDISAPGENIPGAHNSSDTATTSRSGTSMAAPHVTGIAALYMQNNPNSSPAVVENYLRTTATNGVLTGLGNGTPNLLAYAGISTGTEGTQETKPPRVTIDTPTNNQVIEGVGSFQIVSRSSAVNGISSVRIKVDGSTIMTCPGLASGETTCSSIYFGTLLSLGTHTISVEASDRNLVPRTTVKSIQIIKQ